MNKLTTRLSILVPKHARLQSRKKTLDREQGIATNSRYAYCTLTMLFPCVHTSGAGGLPLVLPSWRQSQ